MAKKNKGSKPTSDGAIGIKLIASNPNAKRNFFIEEVVEAGIVLAGTEVKSLRMQSPNLRDAYVDVKNSPRSLEAWLLNCHIAPYSHGSAWNHEPSRDRKLLLHRREIERLFGAISQKGQTAVPTKIYFKKGRVKLEIGLGKGKKKHDKRDSLAEKSADREIRQAMKNRRS